METTETTEKSEIILEAINKIRATLDVKKESAFIVISHDISDKQAMMHACIHGKGENIINSLTNIFGENKDIRRIAYKAMMRNIFITAADGAKKDLEEEDNEDE